MAYFALAQDTMAQDATYMNQKTGEPNYKKVCEKAIDILHLLKTRKLRFVLVGRINGNSSDEEIEYIKKLLQGDIDVSD